MVATEGVIWQGSFPTLNGSETAVYRVVLIHPEANASRTEHIEKAVSIHMHPIVSSTPARLVVEMQVEDVLGAIGWELTKETFPIEAALLTLLAEQQEGEARAAAALGLPSASLGPQSNLETEARLYAIQAHGTQLYGTKPYLVHLTAVRQVLLDEGYVGAIGAAAWLHDVLEDTTRTREDLAHFGADVVALVWAVTGEGLTREDRNRSAYRKIREVPNACNLKLADRIANVEASARATHTTKFALYQSERNAFEAGLHRPLGDARLWKRLDAAFALGESR